MSEKQDSGDETISSITRFLMKASKEEMEGKENSTVEDEVADAVSELIEVMLEGLSKDLLGHYTENKDSINNSKTDVPSEGPVRRSSRLQRLIVQKDVDKKSLNKKRRQNTKRENEREKKENSTIGSNENDGNTEPNPQDDSDSDVKSNKDEKSKKGFKTVLKKCVKEDVRFNDKIRNDKKRKKKLSSVDLDKSIDDVICDVINSSMNSAEFSGDSIDKTAEDSTKLLCDEENVPETVGNAIQLSENQNGESKDKILVESNLKPVKVKSRWWRSSELEGTLNTDMVSMEQSTITVIVPKLEDTLLNSITKEWGAEDVEMTHHLPETTEDLLPISEIEQPLYEHIDENIYKFERKKSKSKKQVKRMVCDCTLTKEELECGIYGCKEECLNRLLMIECGSRCLLGEHCSNKNFQRRRSAQVQVFKTEKKGWGLKALDNLSVGDFLLEFVGEVVNHKEYRQRVKLYAKEKKIHSYFMALKTDEILDATSKGNYSRFINHSCNPNCETQKWTVDGELRVGVFTKRTVYAGEEFTLDYQFQRYGREAQKCYCGADNCSGYIGGNKQISIDAYSIPKSSSGKKKKSFDDKKRDLDDLTLKDEIEKLNSVKGLRNREETLKLARLMVLAEESKTRHQLLDIIIKTEEQACLRLFLDYHGLPLMWSWMTDIVDVDLKAKMLQVLALLPITNKTMLIDSKVMNVVEKWVQECDAHKQEEQANVKPLESALASPIDETTESAVKKLKVDFSDSETDSSGSHNANDNASVDNSTSTLIPEDGLGIPKEGPVDQTLLAKSPTESDSPNAELESLLDSKDNPPGSVNTVISSAGSELLVNWRNLKEVFRIPRLEQQKRKEDEIEADQSVLKRTEPKPPPIEGDHIQVLISRKTRFSDVKAYDFDSQEMNAEFGNPEMTACNNLLAVHTSNELIPSFLSEPTVEVLSQEIVSEEPVSIIETPSPVLANASPIMETPNRSMLLPTSFITPPPVNVPPLVNVPPPQLNPTVTHLQQAPPSQTMYPPPPMVYPRPQVPFLDTSAPPPVISHTPMSMQPPLLPPSSQMLQQPPPSTGHPLLHSGLPPNPNTFQLPPVAVPSMQPASNQFIPNQPPPVASFPHPPHPFGSQNQPFYFVQPPIQTSICQTTFTENVYAQTSMPPPTINPLPNQTSTFSLPSSTSLAMPHSSVPLQSSNTLTMQPPPSMGMPPPMPVSMQIATSLSMQPAIAASTISMPVTSTMSLPIQLTATLPVQPDVSVPVQPLTAFAIKSEMPESVQTETSQTVQPAAAVKSETEIPVALQSADLLAMLSTHFPIEQVCIESTQEEEPKPVKLPKNWRSATDEEGNVYYYHSATRETQWDPPTLEQIEEDSEDDEEDSETEESESSDTPTYDEPKIFQKSKSSRRKSKKRKTTKAAADTSVSFPVRPEIAKKIKELFRTKMSSYIVHCLNAYRKADCKVGRIATNEDFKYLARKLTHYTMTKELKQCKNVEDLDCNEQVMHKAKDFIKKYMSKYGSKYSRKEKYSPET